MVLKAVVLLLFATNVFCALWSEKDKCIHNNLSGTCVPIDNCPSAIKGLILGQRPHHCGFIGKQPVVCCVNKLQSRRKSLHEEKCEEFLEEIKKIKDDDYSFISVVGGTDAKPGEYPHMAVLGYGEPNDIQWHCGGSLISKKFVLTAAHCLQHPILGLVKYVQLGDIYLNGSFSKNFNVKRQIRHPNHNPPIVYNDIALLELDKEVTLSTDIKPACLHPDYNISKIEEITATGWGLTEYGGSASSILQTVPLDLFTLEECNGTYSNQKRRIPNGILKESQICAGGRDKEQDTCQGDSGGPLQWRKDQNDYHKIIGVTSLGKGCGVPGVPAIYTRVAPYIPWIESVAFA